MAYHPLLIDVASRPCVVIGGGTVAERKVCALLESGAEVTVISPTVTATIRELADDNKVTHRQRCYEEGDLKGSVIAYCATNRRAVNQTIRSDAERAGVLLNVVDDPGLSDFISPALVRRGALLLAVSSSGACPVVARRIRERLEVQFGEEYAPFMELVGAIRIKLLKKRGNSVNNIRIFEGLIDSPLLEWIREGRTAKIDALLHGLLGDGFGTSQLGIKIGK